MFEYSLGQVKTPAEVSPIPKKVRQADGSSSFSFDSGTPSAADFQHG